MLRKVSSISWHNLSHLKLREELSIRGLSSTPSKLEMVKTLSEYESNSSILSSIPENPSNLENPIHRHLPNISILKEIKKLDPDFELNPNMSKPELIASLKSLLIKERSSMQNDLRNLINQSTTSEPLNLKEVISVFQEIRDIKTISEINFNLLLHTENHALAKIWEFLFDNVKSLSFKQLNTVVLAANVLQNVFQKEFFPSVTKLPKSFIEKLINQACETSEKASSLEIASLLSAFNSISPFEDFPLIPTLQVKMIENFDLADVIDDMSLIKVITNLPKDCNSQYSHKIDQIEARARPLFEQLSSEDMVSVVFGLHRSGRKISFEITQYLDTLLTDGLKRIHKTSLRSFGEILVSQGLVSELVAGNLINSLIFTLNYDSGNCEKFIDFSYFFYENNISYLILSKFRPISKISSPNSDFPLESYLKFGILYWTHCTDESLMINILLAIVKYSENSEEISKNFNLILELQRNLLENELEKPIFNYQFNSFENFNHELRDRVIQTLHNIIKTHDPSNLMVFQYYSEYINAKSPEDLNIKDKVNQSNFTKLCKTIWRFKLSHLSPSILTQSLEFLQSNPSELTEGLYYLTSSNPSISSEIPKNWDFKGIFQAALSYNLNIDLNPKTFNIESLNEKISLSGEILLKTLIKLSQSDPSSNIFKLSSNLNFTPATQPATSPALISEFFNQMQKHLSPINYSACSSYISSKLNELEKSDLISLFSFFKDHWNILKPELQNFFEENIKTQDLHQVINQGLSVNSIIKMMKERDDSKVEYENIYLLDILSQYKVYNDQIVKGFINLLPSLQQAQSLSIVSKLLDLFSITSCRKAHFEQVFSLIDKLDLWSLFSIEDCVNFFIVYYNLNIPGLVVPANFQENFKYNLLKLDNSELLLTNPELQLQHYKAFKYTTEFEPRSIISNNQGLKEVTAEVNVDIEIPENEVLKQLKKYCLFVHFGIEPNEEIKRTVKYFYKNKEKNLVIKNVKSELLEIIQNDLKYKVYSINNESQENGDLLWKYDVGFNMSRQVYIIHSNSDFCYMPDGSIIGVTLVNKFIKTQLQEKLNLKVAHIVADVWNKYSSDQKEKLAQLVGDNLISNKR